MIPVIIWPGAMRESMADVWRAIPDELVALSERAEVFRLHPLGPVPMAELIGLPGDTALARGPLAIAAFGYDPPANSVQFEVTVLGISDDGIVEQINDLTSHESALMTQEFVRLNTQRITLVAGERESHGLVWERGSADISSPDLSAVVGARFGENMIEGDGERHFRQLIEDSVNLLDSLPFNRVRSEEGKRRANLLWPWGPGFRPQLPNLAVRSGVVANIMSESLHLAGLCRLTGLRHSGRDLRNGLFLKDSVYQQLAVQDATVMIDTAPGRWAEQGNEDDVNRNLAQFTRIAGSVWADEIRKGSRSGAVILCPSQNHVGLGMIASPDHWANAPFEPGTIEDDGVPLRRCFEVVQAAMSAL